MLDFLKEIFNPQAKPKEASPSAPLQIEGEENRSDGTPLPVRGSVGGEASSEVDTQHTIIDAVIRALHPFRGSNRFKGITFWATDNMYVYLLRDEAFEALLRSELENNLFTSLSGGTVEVKTETPTSGALCAVTDKVFFTFNDGTDTATCHRLKVKVMPRMGSLVEPEYVLESAQTNLFYVGRGEVSNRGGQFHRNDVAIREDDPDTEIQAMNNQVSRTHAKIVYADGRFFLQALPSGCRSEGGSVTKIAHGKEQPVEIRDTHSRFPLSSGDYIILGKAVCLKVEVE